MHYSYHRNSLFNTEGSDYTGTALILEFRPGVTSISVSLPLIDDDTFEITEMLQGVLVFPETAPPCVSIDPELANITILDDDGELICEALWLQLCNISLP